MSSEKIFEKIKQDAENEAASILKQAAARAETIRDSILKKANAESERNISNANQDAQSLEQRRVLSAKLEARKNSLVSKRAVINEAFALAEKDLNSLSDERWAKLITRVVVKSSDTGSEVLRVPAKDIEKYQSDILSKLSVKIGKEGSMLDTLNQALFEQKGIKGKLKLDSVPADFDGGVKLIGEKYDVNCSYKVLLRGVRENYEPVVAELLFQTEVQ